jgi:hypothetical protein
MEGRSAARRREEKKPTAEEGSEEGAWKRPRGSEREDGWEREQWPETEMDSTGAGGRSSKSEREAGGAGRWEARPKRRPSQSPAAAAQRWRSAARAAPEMERLGTGARVAASVRAIGSEMVVVNW